MDGKWTCALLQTVRHMNPARSTCVPCLDFIMTSTPLVYNDLPWMCVGASWGNFVVEICLPIIVYLTANTGQHASYVLLSFLVAVVCFHVANFFLMWPNFIHQVMLVILAANPLAALCSGNTNLGLDNARSDPEMHTLTQGNCSDSWRALLAYVFLCGALSPNWWSDLDRLVGTWGSEMHHDPVVPFSEFPMFADVEAGRNYKMSFAVLCCFSLALISKIVVDVNKIQHQLFLASAPRPSSQSAVTN
eukprot:CAMPEP_0178387552 /NCGR_PEP_ID=MMETSP0689_2-20121128/9132_1 /TAXON_ID=160604 /ORGANISM="Amphidinium massartii, Strain CS-259" /LENGTH=246 /DNA_ID=CAMNT_0020007919 /DNA_START=1249 /DNA_END=1985 /DNA_ORIENTATION=+